MANMRSETLGGTLSRLMPSSRSKAFRLPIQLRDRIVLGLCPESSDQSSQNLEQHRILGLNNELQAIISTYMASSGRQDLSPSTRGLYGLVADLAKYAAGDPDTHPPSRDTASDMVRCIVSFVEETASEFNATNSDLARMAEDTRLFRFHAALGDYAGSLCEALKGEKSSIISRHPWTIIVPSLDKESAEMPAWLASGPPYRRPVISFLDALEERAEFLTAQGWGDVDLDLALFAVRAYARRNLIAHGGNFDLFTSDRFEELANHIEDDDKNLESLLPDEEKSQVGKYRRLLILYRNSHIRMEGGKWVKYVPRTCGSLPSFVRPCGDAFRCSVDVGRFRPEGLTGPPPPNVLYSPSSLRRHSVSEPWWTLKRPATEQPDGEPPAKKRAYDYRSVKYETIADVSWNPSIWNVEYTQLATLCENLVNVQDALRQLNPMKAKVISSEQIPHLEAELERLKRATAKKMKAKLKQVDTTLIFVNTC